MDKRRDSLNTMKMCRFCLTQDVPMGSLYDKKRKVKNTVNLPLKILSCVSVEVFPSDKMPIFICERCKYFMNIFYDFKQICRQADESILHFIQDNKPLAPVPWPLSLNDVYRDSNDIGVMKTVVEGGTTVQVTHDVTDSEEEEDENIYNVKINDGSSEGSKTCIKVVESREYPGNDDMKRDNKGPDERCWACDECDCTYPLQQLLELHKLQKHRARNVQCDQCEDKFFTKYDLAVHQVRHSDEMPFQCDACGRKFKRLVLLKRHEKIIHSDLIQQVCEHCPATFLSTEQLEAHQQKHERDNNRPFACSLCDKKFLEKATLQRHKQLIHDRVLEHACEYCPQRFSSVSKLSRHVRTHAGERPYPCKYCDKTFMKSHHYTRHLRLKHREAERARLEAFRCDQCEVSFGNQDELIYHSAIHATQNLTCPLCQEKFPNVDAVTAHIKSHVSGVEYMCDYCELVFTTKEKLETHTLVVHDDEIQQEIGNDESSMETEDNEADVEPEEDDDNCMNVKEEDDHMVVEIKKPSDFMLKSAPASAYAKSKDNSNSEESDAESTFVEHASSDAIVTVKKITAAKLQAEQASKNTVIKLPDAITVKSVPRAQAPAPTPVVRKPEEIKRQATQLVRESLAKKEKPTMAHVAKVETANDKSLRLLEKELQDLKRTNSRSEAVKTPVKSLEVPRGRGRPPLHTSTPKIKKGIYRPIEEKKPQVAAKLPNIIEKKTEKKVVTKENKEPKDVKEAKGNVKEDKEVNNKSVIKNGTSEKPGVEDGIRRSTRPSKIKDYAKMIRLNTQEDSDSDELYDDDDYKQEKSKSPEQAQGRAKGRRSSVRPASASPAAPAAEPAAPPRKRGRPRKDANKDTYVRPAKVKKVDPEPEPEPEQEPEQEPEPEPEEEEDKPSQEAESDETKVDAKQTDESQDSIAEPETEPNKNKEKDVDVDTKNYASDSNSSLPQAASKSPVTEPEPPPSDAKLVSPTGQTLKKVPIRSLPPGVKPLPLPLGRTIPSGELCEMQIGKKVVKVQKIVMTKAEVEEMAKKGLVEMKDGTMVLKQGIKLPKVESTAVRTAANEGETTNKRGTPTRCDMNED
ncbi:uncharacterized protein [Epargyreus clarus]|uniref:uncharacterized protein n=1 Tax=Epargyreus clarus TaxID=520877 RepID=UPI003C2F1707